MEGRGGRDGHWGLVEWLLYPPKALHEAHLGVRVQVRSRGHRPPAHHQPDRVVPEEKDAQALVGAFSRWVGRRAFSQRGRLPFVTPRDV